MWNGTHVKTTVELPDDLLRAVKKRAMEEGLTFRQAIESGLRRWLEETESSKPLRLKDGSFRGTGLVADLDWPQIRERIYEGRGG